MVAGAMAKAQIARVFHGRIAAPGSHASVAVPRLIALISSLNCAEHAGRGQNNDRDRAGVHVVAMKGQWRCRRDPRPTHMVRCPFCIRNSDRVAFTDPKGSQHREKRVL
jgi:hypothetical protein